MEEMEDSDEKKPGIQEYVYAYCRLFASFFGKQALATFLFGIVCRRDGLLFTIFNSWLWVSGILFCIFFGIAGYIAMTKDY